MRRGLFGRQKMLWMYRLCVVGAAVVLLAGAIIAWRQHYENEQASRRAARAVHAANTGHATGSNPSTTKPAPSAFEAYQVPPANPRYIFIPTLSVRAVVRPLGLTSDNSLSSPANIYDTGWYTGSAKPGQPGAMVIDGHVSSWTAHGVFYDIKNLKPGDGIQVEKGDGSTVNYKVVKRQVYAANKVDMAAVFAPVNGKTSGLNLITCDGTVVKGTNEFNQRIVVFAEQVSL